jgi:hypothetical protein
MLSQTRTAHLFILNINLPYLLHLQIELHASLLLLLYALHSQIHNSSIWVQRNNVGGNPDKFPCSWNGFLRNSIVEVA